MAGVCRLRSAGRPVGRWWSHLTLRRSYGAAAVRVDDYYEYEDDEEEMRLGPLTEPCGSSPDRGVQWVVMGYPGLKKSLYAERLSKLLQVPHISMGTLVRQELNPCSSLYKQIANAINGGKLVPEDIIFGLLSKRLEEGYNRGETGFILDGIPRTRIQAEILDQIADIDMVVNFKCNDECLLKKHMGSGICKCCGNPPSLSNSEFYRLNPCPTTFPPHLNAGDAYKEKLQLYAEQSKSLEDYYRKQRKLVDFQVVGSPRETWQGLLAALRLQHMDNLRSSNKLTV